MTWLVIERPGVKLYKPYYRTIKRVLEIILCLLLAPFLVPLFLAIAVAIKLGSPGPIFFVQERIGKGGRSFKMIKFRTMHHNLDTSAHRAFMKAFVNGQIQEDNGKTVFKPFEQNQVTRVGRLLRKTSLDELPQLINVFKGEMGLVGPRPNVPWEVEEYRAAHQERLEVLPGITGLAQVRGRSGITFDEIVQYDIEYIEKHCLTLDLKILWWTFASVLFGKGAG
jgi:lipopolysaccharide/colanic/teichoic acid biosynthesis glycosyltransferase